MKFFQRLSERQREFQVNHLQLLYYLAPLSAVSLTVTLLMSEPVFGELGMVFAVVQTWESLVSAVK